MREISNIKKSIDHLHKNISIMIFTLSTFVQRCLIEPEEVVGLVSPKVDQIPIVLSMNIRVAGLADKKLMASLHFL
jgi:hypothetical protein